MLKGSEQRVSLKRKQGPLYQQIQKILKDRILHGVYPLGSIIPSEPQLEKEFGVSKMTVRGAVQELSLEGYVQKKSGVGTIVMRNTSHQKLSKGKRFTELLVEEGHKLEKRVLNSRLVSNDEGTEEYDRFGPYCQRIERLYILNGQPYIHLIHFLAAAALPGGTQEMNTDIQSLYDSLEENDIMLENFRDRFFVEPAPPEVCRLLEIPAGMHVLKRLRNSYDGEGRLIEHSIGCYNTELHHYLVSYDT
ncbi:MULTISPECIES: GntR family transcriptional regulator [unclassified Paenibacillus]|jgi:DNA-binding GntR family transcriptional regulator|uniref:GntR family transcriptional regulator n=1 Tax=unclassified Paenibacillus TaxID=185978 RepID=UPI00159596B2|nr:GntR family transcriptional regulator [Paenibacillus sp. 7523-1]MBM6387130.1 GntR family transcriptional regulator [Paenibacillus sp.]